MHVSLSLYRYAAIVRLLEPAFGTGEAGFRSI
eukprot:COSAG03_NODE_11872_length_572_cov_1.319239_2_plen_31_part_01